MTTYEPSDGYPQQGDRDALELAKGPGPGKATLPPAAEEIASMVDDLRKGRIAQRHKDPKLSAMCLDRVKSVRTVVDATALYDELVPGDGKSGKEIAYYESHPCIAPPFDHALIAYQNGHGNIIAMDCKTVETDRTEQWKVDKRIYGELVDDDPEVDWTKVRWTTDIIVWCGGQGGDGIRTGTKGPLHMWRIAIYEDGSPADLSWVNLTPSYPMELWDMAFATVLGTLNFLNCRNVDVVEPQRSRAQARRIARTGVTVKTLSVFPIGKSSRSGKTKNEDPLGTPLTSVRGHFARYGEKYGKGLLFGKYEGMFWHPQHARGSSESGTNENSYRIRTDQS